MIKKNLQELKKAAEYIKSNADILVVIGIGGSYLGARAVIEALTSPNYNSLKKIHLTFILSAIL